jgi:hypothetical protein
MEKRSVRGLDVDANELGVVMWEKIINGELKSCAAK